MIGVGCLALALASPSLSTDWEALERMAPGPARGALVLAALEDDPEPPSGRAQSLAFQEATRASAAFELDLGLDLFRTLTERLDPGGPKLDASVAWAPFNLALLEHRAGFTGEADRLLADLLARGPATDRTSLWNQRAIFAYGSGDDARAQQLWGHALGLGNADASAILAREALKRHNLGAAQRGFRAAIARNPEHPWALRGWGLSLLTVPNPSTKTPTTRSNP